MVRPHSSARTLIIAILVGLVSLAFFSYLFLRKGDSAAEQPLVQSKKTVMEVPEVTIDPNAPTIVKDASGTFSTFTSSQLGVRFSYQNMSGVADPVEVGNSISFLGYTLYVFTKNPKDSFEEGMRKLALNVYPPCSTQMYDQGADGVVKAQVVTGTCIVDSFLPTDGGHFFIYPNYSGVFFFVRGPAGTPSLFDHRGTWLDKILIRG